MLIRWMQLSDLHHLYSNYETTVMRDQLLDYLKGMKEEIQYLFITGDIAHRGSDYNKDVIEFLDNVVQACEITKEDVFMVPGNHDLKRSPMAERLANQILASSDVRAEINNLDDETHQVLLSGQNSFFEFYKKFLGEDYPKDSLHFVKSRNGFNVVHVNTCIIAGLKEAEGKILVGLNKVYDTLKALPNPDNSVNIAIGHHTIGCLHEAEKESLLNRFSDSKIDIYLNGHVHRAKYQHDDNNYNEIHCFTCGGGFVDGYADPLFIVGSIDTESATGNVCYHKWNAKGEYWHIDNTIGRKTSSGSFPFDIKRLKKKIETDEQHPLKIVVDEDEFKEFLIDFHTTMSQGYQTNEALIPKDITEKFNNMLCSPSFKFQFDKCSVYFPVINKIMGTTSFLGIDKRFIIPNVIFTEYLNLLHSYSNGDLILVNMIDSLCNRYKSKIAYSEERLKSYIRVLIFWSIYECDIFNEDKREKDVV